MGEQIGRAVEVMRLAGIDKRSGAAVIGALISQAVVQWPEGPRIISNLPDLIGLPEGSVIRETGTGMVFKRGDVAWWAAGSDTPWAISEITLPAEVLA